MQISQKGILVTIHEVRMRIPIPAALTLATLALASSGFAQKQARISPKILAAKTIYFENKTASDTVGSNTLDQLKKWGRFQVVSDPKKADLIMLLTADPYRDGELILSGGQTGHIDSQGQLSEDQVPNYNRAAPTREAYLTVFDSSTNTKLWTASHVWGGVLTGVNSVGARLVKELQKQSSK
jgi:hypothetical protein